MWLTYVNFRFLRSLPLAAELCAWRSSEHSLRARAPNISHGPGSVGGARPGRIMVSARALKSSSITLQKGIRLGVKVGGGYLDLVLEPGAVQQVARAAAFAP